MDSQCSGHSLTTKLPGIYRSREALSLRIIGGDNVGRVSCCGNGKLTNCGSAATKQPLLSCYFGAPPAVMSPTSVESYALLFSSDHDEEEKSTLPTRLRTSPSSGRSIRTLVFALAMSALLNLVLLGLLLRRDFGGDNWAETPLYCERATTALLKRLVALIIGPKHRLKALFDIRYAPKSIRRLFAYN